MDILAQLLCHKTNSLQWTIVLRKMILGLLSRQSIITIREKTRRQFELRTYGKKYYLEEISDYLGQTRTKLYCSNLNQLLFHNNGYSGKFLCDPAVWNEYLLIKGLLNKFDYMVSAGYESAELACDIREKKAEKEVESFLKEKIYGLLNSS